MEIQPPQNNPSNWLLAWTTALQWPVVVTAAFALGCYVTSLRMRVLSAEKNIKDLVERHLPHVHNALAAIQGALSGRR